MSCKHCNGKGVIQGGAVLTICPDCVDAKKLLHAIKVGIQESKRRGDKPALKNLLAVKSFLPKYPVMACMEAEARKMPKTFINLLHKSFGVRQLK